MSSDQRHILAGLIRAQRDAILAEWRHRVKTTLPAAQDLDVPTLNDHVGSVIEDLAIALEEREPDKIENGESRSSPPAHGQQRLRDGFDIVEVVAEYGIMRSVVFSLAGAHAIVPAVSTAYIVNKTLDDSIGLAVQAFDEMQNRAIEARRREHLSFVAHDLRTPLLAISLSAAALREELAGRVGQDDVGELLETIESNTKSVSAMVAQILEEERNVKALEEMDIERRHIHLWPLVEKLRRDLAPLAHSKDSLINNRVPKNLVIFADARLLAQALQNLLSNGIKYTTSGTVEIFAKRDGASIVCNVRDNGAGIPESRLAGIFDKWQTDPDGDHDGIGLGLAIVKQVVEAHGGRIEVTSIEGEGADFRFTIPSQQQQGA